MRLHLHITRDYVLQWRYWVDTILLLQMWATVSRASGPAGLAWIGLTSIKESLLWAGIWITNCLMLCIFTISDRPGHQRRQLWRSNSKFPFSHFRSLVSTSPKITLATSSIPNEPTCKDRSRQWPLFKTAFVTFLKNIISDFLPGLVFQFLHSNGWLVPRKKSEWQYWKLMRSYQFYAQNSTIASC